MSAGQKAHGGLPPGVTHETYDRLRHGNGPAEVIEHVYREFRFTWDPRGYHWDVLHPEKAYVPPDALFEVAVEGGEVIGTVGGTCHDGVAELKRLYLYDRHRGRGVGRALLDRFIGWARERGCTRAILWSDKRFTDAHRLYALAGFQVMGERICNDPDQSPEFGYALELT